MAGARRCGRTGSITETSLRSGLKATTTLENGWKPTWAKSTSCVVPGVVRKLPTVSVTEETVSSGVLTKVIWPNCVLGSAKAITCVCELRAIPWLLEETANVMNGLGTTLMLPPPPVSFDAVWAYVNVKASMTLVTRKEPLKFVGLEADAEATPLMNTVPPLAGSMLCGVAVLIVTELSVRTAPPGEAAMQAVPAGGVGGGEGKGFGQLGGRADAERLLRSTTDMAPAPPGVT